MRKKLIAILLCVSMIALCACGKNAANDVSSDDKTASKSDNEQLEKELQDIINSIPTPTPTPEPAHPNITFGSEDFRILGLSIDDIAEMSNEDVKEAFKAATGADDDAINMGYGELENTNPEKYSHISFEYSENTDETEIQVRDHAPDKNPYSSYAAIYLYNFDNSRSFDALLWSTEFDEKYISGLELSNEMTKDDIYKMLDFDTLKELAGDDYYEDEYQIQMNLRDVITADGTLYNSLYFIQSTQGTIVEVITEKYRYQYSYSYKDDKLDRFGVSVYPKK